MTPDDLLVILERYIPLPEHSIGVDRFAWRSVMNIVGSARNNPELAHCLRTGDPRLTRWLHSSPDRLLDLMR